MRIAVVTSYDAAAEPRAPRHAVAARLAFPSADVVLIDAAPQGQALRADPPILNGREVRRRTLRFPTRNQPLILAVRRAQAKAARLRFLATGGLSAAAFGERTRNLSEVLVDEDPDLCIAHNIDTLLVASFSFKGGRRLIFDCMEFYEDMGDGQSHLESALAAEVQRRCLPRCALVLSTSDRLSAALTAVYGIPPPLASYNVPPLCRISLAETHSEVRLYWRNSVIDFGQRGLDDALVALTLLPRSVSLTVQGRPAADGGASLRSRLKDLGLTERVRVLPPYAPGMAVESAALYDVGLCLERAGPRNHELTVSNKMFDYHMAGLAVVSSDLPSLRDVIERSGGGILYAPGDPKSLADAIDTLATQRDTLQIMKARARRFSETEANLEAELNRLSLAFRAAFSRQEGATI